MTCRVAVDQVRTDTRVAAPDWVSSCADGSDLDSPIEVKRWHCHHVDWPQLVLGLANSMEGASSHLVPAPLSDWVAAQEASTPD